MRPVQSGLPDLPEIMELTVPRELRDLMVQLEQQELLGPLDLQVQLV